MAAYRYPAYRPARRFRSPYRRRDGRAGAVMGIAIGAVLASGLGAKAVTVYHAARASGAPDSPAKAIAPAPGEAGFFTAALADMGAPATAANLSSLAAWAAHEGCWGCVGGWNPLDTTLYEPGATNFNTFDGNLHVRNYLNAAEGAQATAATIAGYPLITAALRSGAGLCGNPSLAGEFGSWSGDGYGGVC